MQNDRLEKSGKAPSRRKDRLKKPNSSYASLSTQEWELILSAVGAYKHNTHYRELHQKLTIMQLMAQDYPPAR